MRNGKLHLVSGTKHTTDQKQKGLPKSNSPRDLARRLLVGLKSTDRKGFLQNIAIREMAGVVGTWVLKSDEMVITFPLCALFPIYLEGELTVEMVGSIDQ
jgi:nuclear pore complex protein Nup98-Nup96